MALQSGLGFRPPPVLGQKQIKLGRYRAVLQKGACFRQQLDRVLVPVEKFSRWARICTPTR